MLLAASAGEIRDQRHFVQTESMLAPHKRVVYLRLADWLKRNARPPAVVAVPRFLLPSHAIGARSVLSLLNLDTGLFTLGGDQAELTRAPRRAGRVDLDKLDADPARAASRLRFAGVSYVVVGSRSVRKALTGSSEFTLVYQFDARVRRRAASRRAATRHPQTPAERPGFAIYRLKDGGQWLHGPNLVVKGMEYSPEKISWRIATGARPGARTAIAAVNWHPNWKAWVDGRETPTHCSPARRVSFQVPGGAKRVLLVFERRSRETLYDAVSIATLVLVLVLAVRTGGIRLGRRARLDSRPPSRPGSARQNDVDSNVESKP